MAKSIPLSVRKFTCRGVYSVHHQQSALWKNYGANRIVAGNNYNPLNSVDPDGRENTKVVAGGDGLVINGVGYSTAVVNEGYGPNSIRADYHSATVNTEWANAAIGVTWTAWSTALSVPAAGMTGTYTTAINALNRGEQALDAVQTYMDSDNPTDFAKSMGMKVGAELFGSFWKLGQGKDGGLVGDAVLEVMGTAHEKIMETQFEKASGD